LSGYTPNFTISDNAFNGFKCSSGLSFDDSFTAWIRVDQLGTGNCGAYSFKVEF